MSNGHYTELSDRAVLRLAGADTRTFLQGLVTADVDHLSESRALYAGLLTPQGKILFDFFLVQRGEEIFVDCARTQAADLTKRLTFYKLRAAVDIEDVSQELAVVAVWGGDGPATTGSAIAYVDPRIAEAGTRLLVPAGAVDETAAEFGLDGTDEAAYHAHRITLGLADSVKDIGSGEHFPHECNFDQIGGIDFKKGCYVGQEVVSRTEHRGTARKRMVPLHFDGAAPATGTEITGNGKAVGEILSTAGNLALGLIRLDRARSALEADGALTAGTDTVHLDKPDWARFDLPGAAE
ncbi:MAG: YgfZ/GcvT domain-containing protein [Hyphomicrobiales bacterium]